MDGSLEHGLVYIFMHKYFSRCLEKCGSTQVPSDKWDKSLNALIQTWNYSWDLKCLKKKKKDVYILFYTFPSRVTVILKCRICIISMVEPKQCCRPSNTAAKSASETFKLIEANWTCWRTQLTFLLLQYGSQLQSRPILAFVFSMECECTRSDLFTMAHMFPLKCCLGGNWVIWIISYSRWALLGFVVVTRLSRPCTLIYEWCIKRSNQDIQYSETKRLCAFIWTSRFT